MYCCILIKKESLLSVKLNLIVLLVLVVNVITYSQDVRINELMSLNINTIIDEDGDYSDWIEMYNSHTGPVNLDGMWLSDNKNQLHKWAFPDLSLESGEFILLFASGKDKKNWIQYAETVIDMGDTWKYRPGSSEYPAGWRQINFDDTNWAEGPSGIGYGDNDDATVIGNVLSVGIRKKFTVTNADDVQAIILHIDYDDAFVAYLNNVEIARSNIGLPGIVPAYNQGASNWREAEIYQGGYPELYDVSAFSGLIQSGENVLAIQVHNYDINSSDLTAIPFLTLGLKNQPANPRGISDKIIFNLPYLHTNFRLSADGETLYLSDADSQITDSVLFGEISSDISYGRYPDGVSDWQFFDQPTPGDLNSNSGYNGVTSEPVISLAAGIYSGSQALSISHPDNSADVHYTLDGSEPDQSDPRYTSPLLISNTSVIRARAYSPGKMPSTLITRSYLINENIDLPVISITTDPPNLWDYNTGIYMLGPDAETDFPHFGANFWQDWEKPVHVEFFETDGNLGFNANAGVKITGGWSRGFPQKSLAFFIRRRYGQAELKYPLFADQEINEFKAFALRNGGNDWDGAMIRDGMMTGLVKSLDLERQAFRPVVVFLNGEYWGIQNLREKINEDFLASHHNLDPSKIDMLENNATALEGDPEHYNMMMDYILNNNIKDTEVYENTEKLVDINNFIDYEVSQIFFDNTDWPGNNIKFWRPQTAEGKWRWILYDTDFGFDRWNSGTVSNNTLAFATETNGPNWPNPPWSTQLLRRLLENDTFKNKFINRYADHLNTIFSGVRVSSQIDSIKELVRADMSRHAIRWGRTYDAWESNVTRLKVFASQRPAYAKLHIRQKFNIGGESILTVQNTNAEGGLLRVNSLSITSEQWQGAYFPGIPIQVKAIPAAGYKFSGWSGAVNSNIDSLELDLTSSMTLIAGFAPDTSLVINEINYNSNSDFLVGDWVEFYNKSILPIDISGWVFKDSDDLHMFTFPDSFVINPDSYIVISRDSAAFTTGFPSVSNVAGFFDFGLNNSGELLRLYDDNNHIIDSLTYMDIPPWPIEPDGFGSTLSLIDPDMDNSLADSWEASVIHGTPGLPNRGLTSVGENQRVAVPEQYSLGQNYPNPFNPVTVIGYRLSAVSEVELSVYNLIGQKVATLVSEKQNTGSYKVEWDASGFSSGVYYYRITAGSYFEVKKMILIK